MIDDIGVVTLAAGKGIPAGRAFEHLVPDPQVDELKLARAVILYEDDLAILAEHDLIAEPILLCQFAAATEKLSTTAPVAMSIWFYCWPVLAKRNLPVVSKASPSTGPVIEKPLMK